jgi:hypothetical protein
LQAEMAEELQSEMIGGQQGNNGESDRENRRSL